MTTRLADKLRRLRRLLGGAGSALVAYSGGVDSALVLAVAREQLGEDRVLACIGVSPSYPARELRAAVQVAAALGARHRQVHTAEHLDPAYAANAADRCYSARATFTPASGGSPTPKAGQSSQTASTPTTSPITVMEWPRPASGASPRRCWKRGWARPRSAPWPGR